MSIVNPFDEFAIEQSDAEDAVLAQVRRDTWVNVLYPQMLTHPIQGKLIQWISQWMMPMRILEVGTFTAYSSICLARGLQLGGKLISIEINEELRHRIEANIQRADLSHFIEIQYGDALKLIPAISEEFDLVYLDADKKSYKDYLRLCLPLLREGGLIMVDNVWWDGKAMSNHDASDKETQGIRAFLDYASETPLLERLLLPMADGLMLLKKQSGNNNAE